MKTIHVIAWILLIIGGINWLLVGLNPDWNVVSLLVGGTVVERIIYLLVGLAALISLVTHKRDCAKCCEVEPAKTV